MNAWMPRCTAIVLVAVGLVAGWARAGHAQFTSYDTFDGGVIDPDRWFAFSTEGPGDAPSAEANRTVEGGQLRLSVLSYGGTASDAGTAFARQAVGIKQLGVPWGAGFITGVKARVTVLGAKALGCPSNPETNPGTRARAASSGNYFNDGSSTGPGDATGDIGAFIQLQKDNDGGSRIVGGIFRCTNASCGTSATLAFTVFTTPWALNAPVPFKIFWEESAGKFRIVASGEVHDLFYPVGVSVAGPPGLNFNNLRVENTVEHCTGGRKKAKMDAVFDDVQVRRQP